MSADGNLGHVGDRLRAGREAAKMSRTDISKLTGISVAKIARIELKGTGTAEELDAYRGVMRGVLGDVLVSGDPTLLSGGNPPSDVVTDDEEIPTSSPPLTGLGADGSVRLVNWNGFSRGDVVKVQGLDGNYRFGFYHRDDKQEYVEVSGPIVRFRDRLVGTRVRCVKPERIFPTRSRARK